MNNEKNEDIYLTTELKPVGFKDKFKNSVLKPFLIFLCFIGIIALLVYFVIIPVYIKYFFRNPRLVFNDVFDTFETTINDFLIDTNKGNYDYQANLSIDSNYEGLVNFKDNKYVLNYTSNNKNVDLLVSNGNNNISYFKRDNDNYVGFNYDNSEKLYSSDKAYYLEFIYNILKVDGQEQVSKIFDNLRKYNTKDYLSYDDEVLNINGEELKVVRNSMKLSKEDISSILDMKIDGDVIINAYTTGITFRGIDIEYNGFRIFYYYESDTKAEVYLSLTLDDNVVNTLRLFGKKKDGNIDFVVNFNGSELGSLLLKEFSADKLDFDFNIYFLTNKFVGSFSYLRVDQSEDINLNVKINKDKYINANVKTKWKYDLEFRDINKDNVLESNEEIIIKEYNSILEKENLSELFSKYLLNDERESSE